MIPPAGFESEKYPLNHRVIYSFGLSAITASMNSACPTLVRHTSDIIAGTPQSIIVNPHNTGYMKDAGAACCKMSIIDNMRTSIKFNLTENFTVDKFQALKFKWRPIHFSFGEKLDAADDDTGTTVATILSLTKDATFEDIVPITAVKLPVVGSSDLPQPVSTVNIAEVFGDYNMTTDTTMEQHTFDEDVFNEAQLRYTNKGALKSIIGRTRHVTLTANNPYRNYFIKAVPSAIRRIQPYSFFAIQVQLPLAANISQSYKALAGTGNVAHLGCKIICNYNEWNIDHYQDSSGTPA